MRKVLSTCFHIHELTWLASFTVIDRQTVPVCPAHPENMDCRQETETKLKRSPLFCRCSFLERVLYTWYLWLRSRSFYQVTLFKKILMSVNVKSFPLPPALLLQEPVSASAVWEQRRPAPPPPPPPPRLWGSAADCSPRNQPLGSPLTHLPRVRAPLTPPLTSDRSDPNTDHFSCLYRTIFSFWFLFLFVVGAAAPPTGLALGKLGFIRTHGDVLQ